ncbi:uncharacterized protein LOC112345469 [Selaginella moellendorffii]|uniref:uncharacterized protein LOC112345469 n=1 Tax=Selaginella moellendorffii TaxID=88036 RepID=UPI000D1CE6D2|nr:uncharacterized protein LOC112345469 [Selaginella moellendorffii]XP_024528079.1 uncharacterized protein LOC112345469 [Selaginella moellendorffii]|eukprot:XP_024528078.1 uncharacterized protein LOC112345469 [Selaginella moellendorffii]
MVRFRVCVKPMSDSEGAPEEVTMVEGRDAAEIAQKQERDTEKRIASEAKSKRRKRDERNREAKLMKLEKKAKKLEEIQRKEEDLIENDSDPEAGVLAMKNSGFLDESVVQFLIDKERKEATNVCDAQPTESRPKRKTKKKVARISIDDRTKLVVLNDTPSHARKSSDFLKQRLQGSHIQRSNIMLKPKSQKKRF